MQIQRRFRISGEHPKLIVLLSAVNLRWRKIHNSDSRPAGTLYPLLHRLESDGLIRSQWDDTTGRRRKWYELTTSGRRRLKQQAQDWKVYAKCIGQLLGPLLDAPPVPAPSGSGTS